MQRERETEGDREKGETIGEESERARKKKKKGDKQKQREREERHFFRRDFTTFLMACTLIWRRPSHAFYDVSMHTCPVCLPSGKPETNKLRSLLARAMEKKIQRPLDHPRDYALAALSRDAPLMMRPV